MINKIHSSSGYRPYGAAIYRTGMNSPVTFIDRVSAYETTAFDVNSGVNADDDFGQMIKFNDVSAVSGTQTLFRNTVDGGTLNYITISNIGSEAMTVYLNGNTASGHVLATSGIALTLDNVVINDLRVSSPNSNGIARGYGLRTPDYSKIPFVR